MRRLSAEGGMTVVELLVAMALALIVFAATLSVVDLFQKDNTYDQDRNEAQDNARSAIDRMAVDLRNVAAPTGGSPGTLEEVGPYDMVFQTVSASTVFGGQNSTNSMRVRYCLDASTPSNEKLWKVTQTWTTSTAPSVPSTASCPGTITPGSSTAWNADSLLLSNITNENQSQNRPLFTCKAPGVSSNTCATETTSTSQVRTVDVDMFEDLNPGGQPGETELTDGIDLRNALSAPTASFTSSIVNDNFVQLDASGSSDPNGESLSYQWYQGSSCTSGNALAGATGEQYDSGSLPAGTYSFDLQVTNLGGLTSCATAKTVTIS